MTRRILLEVFILYLAFLSLVKSNDNFYSLSAEDTNGNNVSFSTYRGKVSLVVNVASECGYTDHNYKELVKLQKNFDKLGLVVLAFPSNQFGQQEPGSNSDIMNFAKSKYSVNFPIFSKSENLLQDSGVYQYLIQTMWRNPSWNFCKYLVDRQGKVVQFFSQKDSFDKIRASVSYLLSKSVSD